MNSITFSPAAEDLSFKHVQNRTGRDIAVAQLKIRGTVLSLFDMSSDMTGQRNSLGKFMVDRCI
jgi:hypothetical protein